MKEFKFTFITGVLVFVLFLVVVYTGAQYALAPAEPGIMAYGGVVYMDSVTGMPYVFNPTKTPNNTTAYYNHTNPEFKKYYKWWVEEPKAFYPIMDDPNRPLMCRLFKFGCLDRETLTVEIAKLNGRN